MNPIIQKLDYNTYFDRQLEAYLLATRQELSKLPPDFDKLSRAKEDFRDNIFNRLIKMINQSNLQHLLLEPLTGTLLHVWQQEYISEPLVLNQIEIFDKIFREKQVCYIKT